MLPSQPASLSLPGEVGQNLQPPLAPSLEQDVHVHVDVDPSRCALVRIRAREAAMNADARPACTDVARSVLTLPRGIIFTRLKFSSPDLEGAPAGRPFCGRNCIHHWWGGGFYTSLSFETSGSDYGPCPRRSAYSTARSRDKAHITSSQTACNNQPPNNDE